MAKQHQKRMPKREQTIAEPDAGRARAAEFVAKFSAGGSGAGARADSAGCV